MGLRWPKPKGKVSIKWSANFAYAIGLLVSDGNLSPDKRHISFVSKDIEQINNFMECLGLDVKIGKTISGYNGNSSHRVQFGDVLFYDFLETIGLHANKSKTIEGILIPKSYFFDFLRGSLDGDGTFYSYWDPRWKSSHMFYLEFVSASNLHIEWLRNEIFERIAVRGHLVKDGKGITYQLKYAKKEALVIIKKMYYSPRVLCLSRKREKIKNKKSVISRRETTRTIRLTN